MRDSYCHSHLTGGVCFGMQWCTSFFFVVVFFLNFKRPLIVLVASTHQLCNCAYRSGIHLCLGFFFLPIFYAPVSLSYFGF